MKGKIIIYSINLNDYDKLNPSPLALFEGMDFGYDVDYLYFSDTKAPPGWKHIYHPPGSRRDSRHYKINSHLLPPHDYSVYLDASYGFSRPLENMFSRYPLLGDIGICKHPNDSDVYQHGGTILKLRLAEETSVVKQLNRFVEEGMPKIAISENPFIVRKNNDIIKKLNECWWEEYQRGSERDQLSLPYAIWKVQPTVQWFPFSTRSNKWLHSWGVHKNARF